jgi:hypothetical protein
MNANTVWNNTANIATLNLTAFNFFQFSSTGGGVSSISNTDATLTIAPSTGVVVAALALNHANTWSVAQTFAQGISIPTSGHFFAPTATITNLNDRVFSGGATAYNGTCCTDTGSWLGVFGLSYLGSAQAGILTDAVGSPNSSVGLTVGARSSPATSAGTAVIGLFPVAINNNSTLAISAWGIYVEAWRVNSTVSQTNAIEAETRNLGNEITSDPFLAGGFGMSATIEAGCGAGIAGGNPCPMGMLIFSNNNPFDSGLVFATASVKARSGIIHAIDLPTMYQIVWYSAANTIAGYTWVGPAGTFNIVSTNGKIDLNGTDGVTCAGINAATFTSLGGLVTHC